MRSAIDVSGVASFSPKRESRLHPFDRRVVAVLADEIARVLRHRLVGVVVDLRTRDHRQPLVEQRDERADHAGLRLAALAEEDDVVAGEQRILELRQHGVLVAEHAGEQRLAVLDLRDGVAPDLLLDRDRLPSGLAQLTEGGGTRHSANLPGRGDRFSVGRNPGNHSAVHDLGGTWRAAPLRRGVAPRRSPILRSTPASWEPIAVPGHWRSTPAFADADGPLLYHTTFEQHRPSSGGRADAGSPSTASSTKATCGSTAPTWATPRATSSPTRSRSPSRPRNGPSTTLAVEVSCAPQTDRPAKRNITGVFQHWDCLDPEWNPGGIWRSVRVEHTGPVRIRDLRVLCREATTERAVVLFRANLLTLEQTDRTTAVIGRRRRPRVGTVARRGREPRRVDGRHRPAGAVVAVGARSATDARRRRRGVGRR